MNDLEVMKAAIVQKKLDCYSYMESLDSADEKQLLHSGYADKTNAEAMQHAFRMYKRDIKKLLDTHVKKYPDER